MPVIVIGADVPPGPAVLEALRGREGEIRAFVSDPDVGLALREQGIKVAAGDVGDGSHIGGAALGCFSAVLVAACATGGRDRSWAEAPARVVSAWAEAVADAGVRRVIWIEADGAAPAAVAAAAPEFAEVPSSRRPDADIAADVARLDDAATLEG